MISMPFGNDKKRCQFLICLYSIVLERLCRLFGDNRIKNARAMINEMAFDIPPKVLKGLLNSDRALDEFINGVYLVEDDIGRRIVTPESTINTQFNPKAHLQDGMILFTITYREEEIVFAEFKLNYKKKG